MSNGHLVCNGIEINSTCSTVCIEGYEKENEQMGDLKCLENGKWDDKRTSCMKEGCGVFQKV